MLWENGSAPIGDLKKFFRFGKHRFYEKTENGCIELSPEQYEERINDDVTAIDNRAKSGIGKTPYTNESGEAGTQRNIVDNKDNKRSEPVSKQAIGEKLRSDTGRSLSNVRGNNNGTSIISKSASMTEDRIDYLIADSGAGMNTSYAQSWITSINPTDFLNLTLSEKAQDRNYFDSMPGDYGKNVNEYDYIEGLKKETRQTPYLAINVDTGEVVGHEGRHRMRALEKQGITSAEIRIEFRDNDGYLARTGQGQGTVLCLRLQDTEPSPVFQKK